MEFRLISIVIFLFIFLGKLGSCFDERKAVVSRTITVSKNGKADFTRVQQAIDSVPSGNSAWIRILLAHGVYVEKVVIPNDKPYIILEGDPNILTAIEYGDAGPVNKCSTFTLLASDFVARYIYFKNTHDHIRWDNERQTTWAVAALIYGDRASFYQCIFLSLQDTLWDAGGRHYFSGCNITGAIDFIWGNGQSIYERCQIRSMADVIGKGISGYITAQGREGPNETTGFVFKDCHVYGSGTSFLGRAYRDFSRVLFSGTYMENIIRPEGWSLWAPPQISYKDSIIFAENNCRGPGADMSHRIPWEKKLSDEEVRYLTTTTSFINQDGWLEKQPF